MRTQPTAGDRLFKMMAFQYKPIEKAMIAFWKRNGFHKEFMPKYRKMTGVQKIRILDMHAEKCGL